MTYQATALNNKNVPVLTSSLAEIALYPARVTIQTQGQPAIVPSEIVRGSAMVVRQSAKWGETVLDVVGPGALIGGGGETESPFSIVATTELALRPIPPHEEFTLPDRFSDELERQRMRRMVLAQASALERVAHFLLQVSEPACPCPSGCTNCRLQGAAISIPLNRKEMGSLLSLTAETLSRCFAQLKRDGVVRVSNPNLITVLNAKALIALGCEGDTLCDAMPRPLAAE